MNTIQRGDCKVYQNQYSLKRQKQTNLQNKLVEMQRFTYKQLDDKVARKIDHTAPRTARSILSADLNTKAFKKNEKRKSTANTKFC